jgi:hypothetical protein
MYLFESLSLTDLRGPPQQGKTDPQVFIKVCGGKGGSERHMWERRNLQL